MAQSKSASVDCLHKRVRSLSKEISLPSLRAALVHGWAEANQVPFRQLERGQATLELLNAGSMPERTRAVQELRGCLFSFSLKALETILESLMDVSQRKAHGAVYTPDYIIDYLLHHGLARGWRDRERLPKICDPCCGSAGFLLRAAEKLKQYNIAPHRAFAECLVGFDKDAEVLKTARCLIELYFASNNIALPGPDLGLHCADVLLTGAQAIWREANAPQGFTLIATNPPYVKLQNLDTRYREALAQRYADFVRGSFSLALLFLVAGHQLLTENGCLAVITQNNLFTSLAGREVRRYLQQQQCLRRIVHFGSQQIFANASAYTCLLFAGKDKQATFEYGSATQTANASVLENVAFSVLRHEELRPEKWRLADEMHLANLRKIETTGKPLGVVADIKVGFATLKDTVFQITQQGDICITNPVNGVIFEIEPEITKPMVKIADLESREDLARNARRIIFPYRKVSGKYQLLAEEELRICFPNTYAYLDACRDLLQQRDKGRKAYPGWYAWGRTQGMEAPGPKLLTKTFSKRPNFILDQSDQLFCNGYAVFPRQSHAARYPLEVLERLLNSRLMHYYARLTSLEIEGSYQCYQKNFIERFGVPDMSDAQIAGLLNLPYSQTDAFIAELYDIPLELILFKVGAVSLF